MKRTLFMLAAALLVLPASAHAEDTKADEQAVAANVHQTLIAAKAQSIVSVKMVIALSGSFRGQSIDREIKSTATGIVVDAAGLVMLSSENFSPQFPPRMRTMLTD